MRVIDADRLLTDRMKEHYYHLPNGDIAIPIIDIEHAPTIIPERKRGRWIKHDDRAGWYCSECATDDYYAYLYNSDTGVYELQDKFCPNCGADMTEEEQ